MSATLSWSHSGFGAKTGVTAQTLIADLAALVSSKSGDAAFSWQVASVNSTTFPISLVLKRKNGSAGRILLAIWNAVPSPHHPTMTDQGVNTNALYGCYFPAGNVDSPSNLSASTGTIMGDDSGAVKAWGAMVVTSIYATLTQCNYFDSAEGVYFTFQNPGTATGYMGGAGYLVVDAADNEYACVMSLAGSSVSQWGSSTPPMPWVSGAAPLSGTSTACLRTNYGSANRVYFQAFACTGGWGATAIGANDITSDTTTARVWFCPIQLMGKTKGEGMVLKMRQMAFGPGTVGPFTAYNTTGPVVAARSVTGANVGDAGPSWLTNFKI